jgi:hypothetical protein
LITRGGRFLVQIENNGQKVSVENDDNGQKVSGSD